MKKLKTFFLKQFQTHGVLLLIARQGIFSIGGGITDDMLQQKEFANGFAFLTSEKLGAEKLNAKS